MRAAALLCLALLPFAAVAQDESQAARDTEFDHLELLAGQAQLGALGIRIGYVTADTRPSEGMYLCGGMTRDEAQAAGDTVAAALQYVPDASLVKVRLRYVVLCSRALAAGQSIGGVPVPPLNLLMLDAGTDPATLQHRTLHELYHLAEYRGGGITDADWTARFGAGYSNSYPTELRRSPIGSGKAGFLNGYGETHPFEDRAELFAYLVLAPRDVAAQIRRAGDTVLKQKAEYVIQKCQRVLDLPLALPP